MTGTQKHDRGSSDDASGQVWPGRRDGRSWWQRRFDKIDDEIQRNRRGEYTVPTWVLAATLITIVAAWAAVIILA